jgi:F0F1-type ATP synthase membrane subunit a
MASSPLASAILFHLGPVAITRPVVTTWLIMAVLALGSSFVTRRFTLCPDRRQAVLELIVTGIMGQIEEIIRRIPARFCHCSARSSSFWSLPISLACCQGSRRRRASWKPQRPWH